MKYNKLTRNKLSLWEDIKVTYTMEKTITKTIKYYIWLWFGKR